MATTKTVQDVLNDAIPGQLESALAKIKFGDRMRQNAIQALRQKVPAADKSQLSTLQSVGAVAKGAPAASIIRARTRAGTATAGELTVDAYGTTPLTGHIAVAPNGDIVVLGTDAWTDLDVEYLPMVGDIVELDNWPVASDAIAIPASIADRGVIYLLSATSLTGTLTGQFTVLVPSGSAATTGTARLDLACANVKFYSGDAVTSASIKLLVSSAADLDALLVGDSSGIL